MLLKLLHEEEVDGNHCEYQHNLYFAHQKGGGSLEVLETVNIISYSMRAQWKMEHTQ